MKRKIFWMAFAAELYGAGKVSYISHWNRSEYNWQNKENQVMALTSKFLG